MPKMKALLIFDWFRYLIRHSRSYVSHRSLQIEMMGSEMVVYLVDASVGIAASTLKKNLRLQEDLAKKCPRISGPSLVWLQLNWSLVNDFLIRRVVKYVGMVTSSSVPTVTRELQVCFNLLQLIKTCNLENSQSSITTIFSSV